MSLAAAAAEHEPLFAVDIFDSQELNEDGSGRSSLKKFQENLEFLNVSHTNLLKSLSTQVNSRMLAKSCGAPIRFVSVDGGHTRLTTCHDLNLVQSNLLPHGIVVVDDVTCCDKEAWSLGVIDGLSLFFSSFQDLEPFLYVRPKLFLARQSSAPLFRDFLLKHSKLEELLHFQDARFEYGKIKHHSRFTLFGGEIVQNSILANQSSVVKAWLDSLDLH